MFKNFKHNKFKKEILIDCEIISFLFFLFKKIHHLYMSNYRLLKNYISTTIIFFFFILENFDFFLIKNKYFLVKIYKQYFSYLKILFTNLRSFYK